MHSNKNCVAIIQARTGSKRLPRKVLRVVCGKTLLEHLILRVKRSKKVGSVVVATTDKKEDLAIVRVAKKCKVSFFCGSELDVLDRCYRAAKEAQASIVVRITGDCPLLDPEVIDGVVSVFQNNSFDYVSNTNPPTFPDGMDVEVCSFEALERSWKEAKSTSEREHVTMYIRTHPKLFRTGNVRFKEDLSKVRLTLDYEQDFLLVRDIYKALYYSRESFTLGDILEYIRYRGSTVVAILGGGLVKENGKWRTTTFAEGDSFGALGDRLRVLAGAAVANEDKKCVLLAVGGKGQLANVRDSVPVAEVVKDELIAEGISREQIVPLPEGDTTSGQLVRIRAFAEQHRIARISIISNRYHLPRIRAMLRKFPELSGWKGVRLLSAEDVLLRAHPEKWREHITKAYRSFAVHERIRKEQEGVQAIVEGRYSLQKSSEEVMH